MTFKKQLLLSTAVAVIAAVNPAMSADMALKAPPPPPAPVYNWTGLYVGGSIGYSWGRGDATYDQSTVTTVTSLPASFAGSQNVDGVIGGPQIGYNWQVNNTWVVGLETDFQWSGEKGSSNFNDPYSSSVDCEGPTCNLSASIESKISWFGTVRGRVGVLATPTLWVYGTGGLAYGRVGVSGSITNINSIYSVPPTGTWSFADSATKTGWTAGGGIEGAIPGTTAWTWKVEYLYIDFGSLSGTGLAPCTTFGPPCTTTPPGPASYNWSAKITDNILRLGVNYRFH
jgi:outer membrane immunogenic protein